MIGYLLFFLIFVSVVSSILTGTVSSLTDAVINSGSDAVTLVLSLAGAMAVWGGVMKVAERSGLTEILTKTLRPLLRLLFRGIDKNSAVMRAIAMNVSANLLGLGNAATPIGITAMKSLAEEEGSETATRNMSVLAVMNSCSVQIIPTTVAALRAASGSASPMEIFPCVIAVSICSLFAALIVVELLYIGDRHVR